MHAKLVQSLVNLYEFISGQNDESDDDILLPKMMENDILLCLTKMRAQTYNIEVLENDSTLILKGQKELKGCLLSVVFPKKVDKILFIFFKGALISPWSFPQKNVPNQYPQLFTLG